MTTVLSSRPQALHKNASIKNLPVNLFASVMGIAGLSIAWREASHAYGVSPLFAQVAGVAAVVVFLLLGAGYLLKAVRHPDTVAGEFRHPVTGNFFGTITIATLLLSSVVAQVSETLAEVVWTAGTLATLALCLTVATRLLHGRIEATHAVPVWFIPGVATLDIAVAGGTMPMPWAHEVNLFALAVGSMLALLFFTMIMARLIHHDPLPFGMLPSLIIMMAPFEVGFLAYTNFTRHVDTFAGLLFYFGLFMFIVLAPKVFRRDIPFATGWWAVSFPLAALASAALKYAAFVQAWPLTALAFVLLAMLNVAIVVLSVRTARILLNGQLLAG